MQQEREAEARRAQESRERMDRLFSLLERMIEKYIFFYIFLFNFFHFYFLKGKKKSVHYFYATLNV